MLDDGRDKALQQLLIEELNLESTSNLSYLTRNDSKDAKAGNLNHALQQTNADLILVLDAGQTHVDSNACSRCLGAAYLLMGCLLPLHVHARPHVLRS